MDQKNKEEQVNKQWKEMLTVFVGILLLFISAVITIITMKQLGMYASGNDIWGHLYKSQLMYDSIKSGDYYPLYIPMWYNGIQPFRYWAPLPYYLFALLLLITAGNIEMAYYLFAGVSIVVGGIPWILLGKKYKRVILGIVLAFLWFFMPENIRVFFCEGNLPRMVTAIIIPWLILSIYKVLREQSTFSYIGIMVFTAGIVMSHAMIGAMMGVGTFLFLLFDAWKNKDFRVRLFILLAMLAGIAMSGIWLVPALSGGLVSMSKEASSSVMESLMYRLKSTLDPFNRLNGVIDTFYYGLSIVIISVAGIFLADRKKKAGYIFALLVLIATTPAMLPILKVLPLNQLFWMMRFTTIVYGFFFFSLMEWNNMKKKFSIIVVVLLLVDCIPSFLFTKYDTSESEITVVEVGEIKEITKQRAAIMDLSTLGSYPSWGLCKGEDGVSYTYGWAWQGASTASNIVLLNTAVEDGNYLYVFDRCLELGNDTVVILKDQIWKSGKQEEELFKAAELSGYQLVKESNCSYLFSIPITEPFGVKTEYVGIGIGVYANSVSLSYPSFTVGTSVYLDDYTIDDLKKYQTVFLSGFEYHNKQAAEMLVKNLAEAGIKVVIDITHVPSDSITKRKTFLDVTAEDISIKNQFPNVVYEGKQINCKAFSNEYSIWNASYIGGVENVIGTMGYENENFSFIGYNDEKIVFIGMNFVFHAVETNDKNAFAILDDLLQTKYMKLPNRRMVPIKIDYGRNHISIECEETNVNTTLAYQDNFVSDDNIKELNNLLIISEKQTDIELVYPYFTKGIIITILGLFSGCFIILVDIVIRRKENIF